MKSSTTTLELPKNPSARRKWLVYQLCLVGETRESVASQAGVTREAISAVMNTPSAYLEEVVARALGMSCHELFPERYDSKGRRLIRTREPHRNRVVASAERSKKAGR